MDFLIVLVFGFALMWLLIVLPQRRRQAAHTSLVKNLKPGDEVVTAGGLYGDVTEIGEDEIAMEIAPGVEVRIASRAIAAVIPPETYEEDEPGEPAAEAGDEAPSGQSTETAPR